MVTITQTGLSNSAGTIFEFQSKSEVGAQAGILVRVERRTPPIFPPSPGLRQCLGGPRAITLSEHPAIVYSRRSHETRDEDMKRGAAGEREPCRSEYAW